MSNVTDISINNSLDHAVKSGKWGNPGAKLYDTLMSSSKMWKDLIDEAYLIVGDVNNNGSDKITPYSRSGCRYPHHIIRDNELVISIPGLKAAYARAIQQGVYRGKVKDHLERHFKELGIEDQFLKFMKEAANMIIEENFNSIYEHIEESMGINLSDEDVEPVESIESSVTEAFEWIDQFINDDEFREAATMKTKIFQQGDFDDYAVDEIPDDVYLDGDMGLEWSEDLLDEFISGGYTEASHRKLKYDFRMGWDYDTGHMLKVVYSLDNIEVTDVGTFYYGYAGKKVGASRDSHLDYVRKNIARKGSTDHQSKGQKVLAIVDQVTNKRLQSAKLLAPHCNGIDTHETALSPNNLKAARAYADTHPACISNITVGQIDNNKTFKTTHWASRIMDPETGENLRFRQIAKAETLKDGRGWKVNNINAKDLEIFGDNNRNMFWHNPNKKQALWELYGREKDVINYLKAMKAGADFSDPRNRRLYNAELNNLRIIQNDIKTIEGGKYDLSIMQKYRKHNEAVDAGLGGNQTLEFNAYMDSRYPEREIIREYDEIDILDEILVEAESTPVEEDKTDVEETSPADKDVPEEKPPSRPKQADAAEADKNGVRRKKLYIAFIEWCKEYNQKNTFGSIFDKDAFKISYPFVPHEMRYFYRLANPMLCVLAGDLTFFPVAELRKVNSKNSRLADMMIFAATPTDMRVFKNLDKKVYRAIEENGAIVLKEVIADTFDTYIQNMIKKGDILNAPLEDDNAGKEDEV